jgi:hypothetical protein
MYPMPKRQKCKICSREASVEVLFPKPVVPDLYRPLCAESVFKDRQ